MWLALYFRLQVLFYSLVVQKAIFHPNVGDISMYVNAFI